MKLKEALGRGRGAAREKDGQVGTYPRLRDGDRQAKKLRSEQRCTGSRARSHIRGTERLSCEGQGWGAVSQSQASIYEDHREEPSHQKEAETQNMSQRWLPGDQGWSLLCRQQLLE